MKKTTKIIIFSGSLILIGGLMMLIGLMNGAKTTLYWDTQKHRFAVRDVEEMYLVQEKVSVEAFNSIDIDADMERVNLIPSDGWYVEYKVMADNENPLTVNNGRLSFKDSTGRFIVMSLSFFSKREKEQYINIYYPADAEFERVDIDLDMGSLNMEKLHAKGAGLELDMGNLDIKDCEMSQVDARLNMGSMTAENSSFGVLSTDLDMGSLSVLSGDIGTFEADMNMGTLTLKAVGITGSLDAQLDMGSAEMSLNRRARDGRDIAYGFDIETDMGDINIDGDNQGSKCKLQGDVSLKISCDMGSVLINLD